MKEKELAKMCNKSTSDCIELAKQLKDVQDRINKVLDFINVWKDNKTELKVSMLDLLQIEDILRGDE